MTKVKKEKRREAEEEAETETGVEVPERSYEEMLTNLNPIAQPMAGRKLTKRLYKCIKKAVKHKNIRRGVKEVQKFINKGEKGIVVLAGDTLPIEVYCHVPVMCEDRGIPYAYIPSKSDLGAAAGSKRPTCVIMVKPNSEYEDSYNDCMEDVQALPLPY
ncbi:H/ACA ribonucleoprotein complex subunit 2-like protein [Aquarana catesbeiana]|uniref:H/ACA ribonucleoprotein complex subunit 2 n=1 Tax=Aquarana catesbeiana TaxID=8400 RepID=A0A2G9SE09_AQUCT|nr:H/ACA ribonucleoprotein complex subunit 2-like protein [Aquarana catesbeiana]